jgi:nucleotide-binding universal stress UspA family protein
MTERSTSQRPSVRTIHRILVALDASPHSREALELAVNLAADLSAEVEGVFIEDATALRAAKLPFAQEVRSYQRGPQSLSDRRIERQMRRQAERAEDMLWRHAEHADVPYSFRVLRGKVAEELMAAAEASDLLALGKTSTASSRRRLGSSAQAIVTKASTPVLVVRRVLRMPLPVLIYYDGSETADAALQLAVRLARRVPNLPLKVLLPDDASTDTEALRERVRDLCADATSLVQIRALTPLEASRLAPTALKEDSGLVVLPAPVLDAQASPVEQFLYELDTPVLVVR